jgi:DNA-binding transcriptional LysR family regulator
MIDWDDLRYFLAIARQRTLSGAARALHVQQSTMGRRLDALQARAGAVLLQKTPGGYMLTPAGESVLAHAERMEAEALAAERAVTGQDVRLAGLVRLTTVETLLVEVLTPILALFCERYPDITLDVLVDARVLSLSRREADVALRLSRPEGHELVARRVGTLGYALYASAAYIARHGAPDVAAGCPGHRAILAEEDLMQTTIMAWTAQATRGAAVALRTNSFHGQAAAAEAGMGVACLSHYLARRYGLVRAEGPAGPDRELWLAVHEDTRHTPRIRALTDALGQGLRERAEFLCGNAQ